MSKNAVETVLSNAADAADALLADAGPEMQQELTLLLRNGQAPYVERLSNAMEGVMILIRFSGK
jgi:hypothetical protein